LAHKTNGNPRDVFSHIYDIKEVETEGTPGRTSDPLAIYIVNTSHKHKRDRNPMFIAPRLATKKNRNPRDVRAYPTL
jgi:hypothetical protein